MRLLIGGLLLLATIGGGGRLHAQQPPTALACDSITATRAESFNCAAGYRWASAADVSPTTYVAACPGGRACDWGGNWPNWTAAQDVQDDWLISVCGTGETGSVEPDNVCSNEGPFRLRSEVLGALAPRVPKTTTVPRCWPAPIGDGVGFVTDIRLAEGWGCAGWYCPPADAGAYTWRGFAGRLSGGLDRLLDVVMDPTRETAEDAWQRVPQWYEPNAEEQACFEGLRASSPRPPPVIIEWVVRDYRTGTRPVYRCDADCITNRDRGRKIANVPVGTPCEGPLTPAWTTRSNQWQFTTSLEGVRGVAVCTLPD